MPLPNTLERFAESLVPTRRTAISRSPIMRDGQRVWIESPDMASDHDVHFPVVGSRFVDFARTCFLMR